MLKRVFCSVDPDYPSPAKLTPVNPSETSPAVSIARLASEKYPQTIYLQQRPLSGIYSSATPIGVVGAISPWNLPSTESIKKWVLKPPA